MFKKRFYGVADIVTIFLQNINGVLDNKTLEYLAAWAVPLQDVESGGRSQPEDGVQIYVLTKIREKNCDLKNCALEFLY